MRKWIVALTVLVAAVANWGCGGGTTLTSTNRQALVLVNPGVLARVNLFSGIEVGNHINLSTSIRDIAVRPTDGKLYGLGEDLKLYSINAASGTCTAVSANPMAVSNYNGGMTFLPGTDTIRFITVDSHNYRINSSNGTIIGTDPDTNHDAVGLGAKSSNTTYYIYSTDDKIYKTNAPQNGVFDLVANSSVDMSGSIGLAIDSQTSIGYIVANEGFYAFDLATGVLTQISPTVYMDIAVIK